MTLLHFCNNAMFCRPPRRSLDTYGLAPSATAALCDTPPASPGVIVAETRLCRAGHIPGQPRQRRRQPVKTSARTAGQGQQATQTRMRTERPTNFTSPMPTERREGAQAARWRPCPSFRLIPHQDTTTASRGRSGGLAHDVSCGPHEGSPHAALTSTET